MTKHLSLLFLFNVLMCYSQITFEEKSTELGLNYSCGTTTFGNGVTFYDVNSDGWDDLTFASSQDEVIRLFLNNNGSFQEEVLSYPVIDYQTRQINWVDIDNDGDKDLFITSDTDGVRLFKNNDAFSFVDITNSAGFPSYNIFTYGASWGDYNNDGFLDVFLTNRDQTLLTNTPNFLYRNNGDGTFTDVSIEAGIDQTPKFSFCSAFFDFNNDGWQDIYVSSDKPFNLNQLYKNNGDDTFTEVGASSGSDLGIDAMTVTIGDFNNDSWFDIYVTNTSSGNVFLKNNGNETFTDITDLTGTAFNSVGWGAIFLDGDNDTDIDLYVSGSVYNNPNLLSAAFYENLNNVNFQIPENAGFEYDIGASHSNAIGDINNDGLPDFVVTNSSDQNIALWENKNTSNNNWLKINLEGTTSNRDGIGSTIELSCAGNVMYRYTHCGEGYLSQNSGTEFFGLGSGTNIEYIKIKWLSGLEDTLINVPVNQTINVVEGSTLSVNDFQLLDVSLTPNPVKNNVTLKANSMMSNISIYNTLMQKVYQNPINALEHTLDVSDLEAGVYFLLVKAESKEKTIRFIKH